MYNKKYKDEDKQVHFFINSDIFLQNFHFMCVIVMVFSNKKSSCVKDKDYMVIRRCIVFLVC